MLTEVLRQSEHHGHKPGFVLHIVHLTDADLLPELKTAQEAGMLIVQTKYPRVIQCMPTQFQRIIYIWYTLLAQQFWFYTSIAVCHRRDDSGNLFLYLIENQVDAKSLRKMHPPFSYGCSLTESIMQQFTTLL